MRILVVGAGAIGGYFGGRLLEAGRDVTFQLGEAKIPFTAEGFILSFSLPVWDLLCSSSASL